MKIQRIIAYLHVIIHFDIYGEPMDMYVELCVLKRARDTTTGRARKIRFSSSHTFTEKML